MGGKVFIRYFRPNLTHATGQRSCYALGKGLTTNGADVWTMFNPLPPKAGLEYTAISLIHWRIIIHRAGIHLKGKKLLHNHFHFFTTEAHPLKRSEKDEPTSSRTPPDDFPFRNSATDFDAHFSAFLENHHGELWLSFRARQW